MFSMDLIVFAKSIKHHNFCVAGKNKADNKWVRPVSSMNGDALTASQCKIQNVYGIYDLKPLKIATFLFEKEAPIDGQPENCLIKCDYIPQQKYKIQFQDIKNYLDYPQILWQSSLDYVVHDNGLKDKVNSSLYLIEAFDLQLYLNSFNKRRANFIYNNIKYDFAVTDPEFDRLTHTVGNYFSSAFLCVSLGENFNGNHYKLVAAIFVNEGCGRFISINNNIGVATVDDIDF